MVARGGVSKDREPASCRKCRLRPSARCEPPVRPWLPDANDERVRWFRHFTKREGAITRTTQLCGAFAPCGLIRVNARAPVEWRAPPDHSKIGPTMKHHGEE